LNQLQKLLSAKHELLLLNAIRATAEYQLLLQELLNKISNPRSGWEWQMLETVALGVFPAG
jgi:hypothetical protein